MWEIIKSSTKGNNMKHTDSKFLYTDVYYYGSVKRFWGRDHRQRALDFFHSLPKKEVEITK